MGRVVVTDTLPAGLGYLSSTLAYTYGWPVPTPDVVYTPSLTVAPLASGNLAWYLGDLNGPIQVFRHHHNGGGR